MAVCLSSAFDYLKTNYHVDMIIRRTLIYYKIFKYNIVNIKLYFNSMSSDEKFSKYHQYNFYLQW